MFNCELLKNEIVTKIDCAGCHDHMRVNLVGDSERSCVMIKKYMYLYAERVKRMKIYDDDVFVVTFPKCGTTWTQELVWLLNNNLDYEKALEMNLNDRFPFLELNGVLNKFNEGDSVATCENLERPRHIKSHLPIFLLPNEILTVKPKLIYVARNPKDVATSFFHHYRHIVGYEGLREDFVNAFLNDQVIYAPFNEHVLDFWKIRDEPNILFLFYEDMKRNMKAVITETMQFLDKNYSDEEIEKLAKHLSVESMRANASCNNDALVETAKRLNENGKSSGNFKFIRQGKIGSFEQEKFDEKIVENFEAFMNHLSLKGENFIFKV